MVRDAEVRVGLDVVARVLTERLAGLTLRDVCATLPERLRDAAAPQPGVDELLNIFIAGGGQLFDRATADETQVLLGQPSLLAEQPEFASGERLRRLLELTETRDELATLLHPLTAAVVAAGGVPVGGGLGSPWPATPGAEVR